MIELEYPFTEEAVRALKAGDAVSVSGRVYTGRDRFHKHFADGGQIEADFRDGALYHCGPVVLNDGTPPIGWRVVAAGPTTSVRENPYEPDFIRRSGVRLIIGKGGMDSRTLEACAECGAVYLQAVGGAAALAARAIKEVRGVSFLEEWGAAEACWEFEMSKFMCVVAMDAHGVSLFERVREASSQRLREICP